MGFKVGAGFRTLARVLRLLGDKADVDQGQEAKDKGLDDGHDEHLEAIEDDGQRTGQAEDHRDQDLAPIDVGEKSEAQRNDLGKLPNGVEDAHDKVDDSALEQRGDIDEFREIADAVGPNPIDVDEEKTIRARARVLLKSAFAARNSGNDSFPLKTKICPKPGMSASQLFTKSQNKSPANSGKSDAP